MRLNKNISIEYWSNSNSGSKFEMFWFCLGSSDRDSLCWGVASGTLAHGCCPQFGHWGRCREGEEFSFLPLMWNCWYTRTKSPRNRPSLASPFSQDALSPQNCFLVTFSSRVLGCFAVTCLPNWREQQGLSLLRLMVPAVSWELGDERLNSFRMRRT